ncbi:halogenation protein CepH [Streptomyces sp. BK208]|uniref:tryptophan 7-halogenase n=1 Tax=Streptomyces sp. BK208 TaxID=2512150 RepID=UPI00105E70CE|nr:tryptophan 7-halogenase [Streptomyces sp. BK208]TDT31624.1 halogenation protein CepH [Streptomyces sp. BK208]
MPGDSYDAIVIGGGPAGSTAATLIALDGNRVLLLEKERFPRYQIGESLLPATVHGICPMLGVDGALREAGFTVKRGGSFRWGKNPDLWTFAFTTSDRMSEPTGFSYQVERSRFDDIMLRNAERAGVEVREEHPVVRVLRDGSRVTGVGFTDPQGKSGEASAQFVLDASGHTGRLHNEVGGERKYSPFFKHVALFGYFKGGKRIPEPNSGNVLSVAFDSGWFWYIPLSPTLTSVGAVVRSELAGRIQGDPEEAYRALIAESPLISEYLEGAERATEPPYDRLRVRKDFSYTQTAMHAPGMALIGDAACFVDPVLSTGVHLATYAGMLAARSVNSVLAGLVAEEPAFQEFERRYRREFTSLHDFLVSFYGTNLDEKSYFWQAQRITGQQGGAAEAFVDLVGGVASGELLPEDPLTAAARTEKAREALVGVTTTTNELGDAQGLFEVPLAATALAESQTLVARGQQHRGQLTEGALLAGGLRASEDGRRWLPVESEEQPQEDT